MAGPQQALPPELLPYAERLFARFPDLLLSFGDPRLPEDFFLPAVHGHASSGVHMEQQGDRHVLRICLQRPLPGNAPLTQADPLHRHLHQTWRATSQQAPPTTWGSASTLQQVGRVADLAASLVEIVSHILKQQQHHHHQQQRECTPGSCGNHGITFARFRH